MSVILTRPEGIDVWLNAPWEQARQLQRPLSDDELVLVEPPAKSRMSEWPFSAGVLAVSAFAVWHRSTLEWVVTGIANAVEAWLIWMIPE